MNIFIDSHAHLNDPAFDTDRGQILTQSFDAGIMQIVEIACEEPEWQPALDLAAQYPGRVFAAAGIHPIEARTRTPENLAKLHQILTDKRIVGLGEIGLDYTYFHTSSQDTQLHVFSDMLQLTKTIDKPIILHIRREAENYEPYDTVFNMLKHEWTPSKSTGYPGVLHCFSGRYEDAVKAVDNGLLLGINGIFSYKRNDDLRETVKKIGLSKIILETDCPYLSPQGKRGQRNDPSNIVLIATFMADWLNIPVAQVAKQTTDNATALYATQLNLL